jgi:hypothetical protein
VRGDRASEDLILTTPARTREGALAQIRRVTTILAHGACEGRQQQGLRLALTTLAGLRAVGAAGVHPRIMPHPNFYHSVYPAGRSGPQPCAV